MKISILSRQQLFETQLHDPPLLFCRDRQFCGGVIVKTALENGKHLGSGFSGRADNEDVSETLPVSAICGRQPFRNLCRTMLSARIVLQSTSCSRDLSAGAGFAPRVFRRFAGDFECLEPARRGEVPRQISSAAAKTSARDRNGRRATISRAQTEDPQQASNSPRASAFDRLFSRSRAILHSKRMMLAAETIAQDFVSCKN